MRVFLLLGLLSASALSRPANADTWPELNPPRSLTLSVTVEQAQLVVQTLGAIGCQNVTQLMVCQQAAELLRSIRDQVKAQEKK